MKSLSKAVISFFVFGVTVAGSINAAKAVNVIWDDSTITKIVNDHQDQITQNKFDRIDNDNALNSRITQVDKDLQSTKLGVLVIVPSY